MKIYDMYGPEGITKTKVGFSTKEEVEEEEKKYYGIWIEGIEYFGVKQLVGWYPWQGTQIKKYLREGRIRGKKIKGIWFVSREDLYRFLEEK
jgi:hypothetical protein